ncbi:MAG: hypothetical protein MZU97_21315 [Bacillus subtilis]|nr:hypothetical protein [Bacillus subtilis]
MLKDPLAYQRLHQKRHPLYLASGRPRRFDADRPLVQILQSDRGGLA